MKRIKKISRAIGVYLGSLDRWLLLLCLLLSGTSVVFLQGLAIAGYSTNARVATQLIAIGAGLVGALLLSLVDYRILARLWKVFLPLCVAAVALTFFFGVERGSNKAWLTLSAFGVSFSVQPAEFLKIAFILTFSLHLNWARDRLDQLATVVLLCLHGAAYMLLIVIQRDSGTALVFLGMFLIMLFLAEIHWKYILLALGVLVPAVPLLWHFVMSGDQKMRFVVMFDPATQAKFNFWNQHLAERYGYQQLQGLKSLGLGGLQGTGFGGKHVSVPESYNDFIFTYIGKVAGLIGCLAVIVLLLLLCFKLIYNGAQATDPIGRMISFGVMSMVLVQSIMNIGMCINLLPVIGVTLPFISAGGSSVLALYLGIGLALSVHRHREKDMFGSQFY